jgi:hypothetical protein
MSTLAVEDQKRMVDVLLVVAVVEAAFLLSVGGICGCIEVQKDLLRRATLSSPAYVELKECFGHSVTGSGICRVLKARDGGLAGKV